MEIIKNYYTCEKGETGGNYETSEKDENHKNEEHHLHRQNDKTDENDENIDVDTSFSSLWTENQECGDL